MKNLPLALIFARLAMGMAVLLLSWMRVEHYQAIAIFLLSVGLLSDIFDGIIARKLNIATTSLRRLDSAVDQVFYLSFAFATYLQCPDFFKENTIRIVFLLSAEVLIYLVCFLKFRKEIATHSIGAKAWSLLLFATLSELIFKGNSTLLFTLCFWVGILSRLEIIAIVLTLKSWMPDVPTLYHALILRNEKQARKTID